MFAYVRLIREKLLKVLRAAIAECCARPLNRPIADCRWGSREATAGTEYQGLVIGLEC